MLIVDLFECLVLLTELKSLDYLLVGCYLFIWICWPPLGTLVTFDSNVETVQKRGARNKNMLTKKRRKLRLNFLINECPRAHLNVVLSKPWHYLLRISQKWLFLKKKFCTEIKSKFHLAWMSAFCEHYTSHWQVTIDLPTPQAHQCGSNPIDRTR